MVQKSSNFNLAAPRGRMLLLVGVVSALGCAALLGSPVRAAAVEFTQPSVEFGIDLSELENGAASLMPTECNEDDEMCGTTSFKVPIQLNVSNASKYNVSIWAEHAGLENGKTGTEAKSIPSVSTGTYLADLNSSWGYRWTFGSTKEDKTNPYIAMPTSATLLHLGGNAAASGNVISSADNLSADPTDITKHADGTALTQSGRDNRYLTLGFAVNIDGDTPAGSYKNKIHIATTASPLEVTLHNLDTMQQMTSDICAATTTPVKTASQTDTDFTHHGDLNFVPEVTLKDTRDGKTYLVRKLADGNCWMSQNLALDFVDDQTLPDLIDDENNPGRKIANPKKFYTGRTKDEEDNMITSGNILVSNAFKLTSANTDLGSLGTNGEWSPSSTPSVKVFKTQTSQGGSDTHPWLDDGSDGMRSFASEVAYPTEKYSIAGAIPEPLNNRTFTTASSGQPYEKYGNLYNWTAATLGSGLNLENDEDEASASICPKGWRLPSNGGKTAAPTQDSTEKSFLNLIRNYDNTYSATRIASFGNDFDFQSDDGFGGIGIVSQSSGQPGINAYNQLAEFPLNFSCTGYYWRSNGYIPSRTTTGYWWSNTANSATNAYNLNMGAGHIHIQDNSSRGVGFAIRCVAR